MILKNLVVGPFASNCYLVGSEIEMMCNELWQKKGKGWKVILNSTTGFLNAAIGAAIMPRVSSKLLGINEGNSHPLSSSRLHPNIPCPEVPL